MTGTAIGLALFIALSGNSILNLMIGRVTNKFGISSFPIFLLVCVAIQATIIICSKKYLVDKNN